MSQHPAIRPSEPSLRQGLVIPAILCGGSGSRLWPVSRKNFAKQHVPIFGGASPFQRTLGRLTDEVFGAPIVISAEPSRFMVVEQAKEVGVEIEIALEPEGRDTLAAVTLAACLAARRDPVGDRDADAVRPSHPGRGRPSPRRRRRRRGWRRRGGSSTLGITPTAPSTAYGYIAPGEALAAGGHAVARFVEKPEARPAAELIAEGCLWNAGMFCFRADAGLREIREHAPGALEAVQRALADAKDDLGMLRLGRAFLSAPKISFDRAVMEHTTRAAVVAADFAWSDIGDWKAVWEHSPHDERGVAREGKVLRGT